MVYCGKPSEGCGPCRAKKTRCDKARPSCGQCLRTKTQCEGYRDISSHFFRDQTDSVVSKVQAQSSKSTAVARTRKSANPGSRHARRGQAIAQIHSDPPPSLEFHLEDFGGVAFFDWFLRDGEQHPDKDCLGLVPDLHRQIGTDSTLPDLLIALGLVSHPVTRQDDEMALIARKRYARALGAVNRILDDPVARLRDDTLMTIILLSIYETLAGTTPHHIKSWQAHLDGVINLLDMRGERQFRTRAGVVMYTHMRGRIIVSCVLRNLPVPERLTELQRFLAPHLSMEQTFTSNLTTIVEPVISLRSDIVNRRVTDQDMIEEKLCELDKRMIEWETNSPAPLRPTRVYDPENPHAFDGYYDVYGSKTKSQFRCHYWSVRYLLHSCRRANLNVLSQYYDVTERYRETEDIIRESCNAILASLPSYLGDVPGADGKKRLPNIFGSTSYIWLMQPILTEPANPPWVRELAYTQLLKIADLSGVRGARVLAEMGRAGIDIDDWLAENCGEQPPAWH